MYVVFPGRVVTCILLGIDSIEQNRTNTLFNITSATRKMRE